jgi:predicted alpha/beta hydrolase family esterase
VYKPQRFLMMSERSHNKTNSIKQILFLHGLDSTPGGSKVKHLESLGYKVLNPSLPADDFRLSLEIAQNIFDEKLPDIVVGSSRGGAIAMAMKINNTSTILIAPAWTHRKKLKIPANITYESSKSLCILHCINDKIVNYKDSKELSDIFSAQLINCGESHRMNDADALRHLTDVVTRLIDNTHE